MKRFLTLTIALISFLAVSTTYSLPNFWFSAVAYNTAGQIITSPTLVEASITISDGTTVFTETFLGGAALPADPFGIININIGTGTNSGNLSSVLMKSNTTINVKVRPVSTTTWVTIVGTALSSVYFGTYSFVVITPSSIPLTTNHILVGNGSGVAADVPMSGDVGIVAGGGTTIQNGVVTNSKLANVPTATFKGRTTAGTGSPEDLTVAQAKTLLNLTGTNSGDITLGTANGLSLAGQVLSLGTASGSTTGALTSADWTTFNNKVTANPSIVGATNTKITYDAKGLVTAGTSAVLASADYVNQGTTTTVLHGNAAGNPSWSAINLGTDVSGTLPASSFPGLTGDVTSPSGSYVTTISNGVVTNPKLANVPTATFKGRTTAGIGSPEDLTVAQAKTLLNLTGTNSGDQTITLTGDVTGSGTGTFAATISNNAVTYAKMQNVSAISKLLGSSSTTTPVQEISIGSGLSLTGTTLSASGSGGTVTSVGLGTGTTGTDVNVTGSPVTGSGTITLNIPTASATNRGALSSADWTTFNNKQPAGSYITALTGDVTAAGPGSVVATLATVNLNVGTFGSAANVAQFTVNGKGLITAASNVPIQITESQVTNLTTDLGNKVTSNGAIIAGTNTKITYDAKGLVTAGASAVLASADFANQGTTTTVLHGNAAGNPSWGAINLGTDVTGTLPAGSFPALTGDVTTVAGFYATTISNNAVTYAKMQNVSSTSRLLGSSTTTTPVQEITIGSGLSLTGTTLTATGLGGTVTSVGLGSGTTGTDVNVTGSPVTGSGTITLNIPTASGTNRGALSSADWTTFNNKQPGDADLTGLSALNSTTTANQLVASSGVTNGYSLLSAPTTNGQVLTYNGSSFTWTIPASVVESDPKVGSLTLNRIPKWGATTLVDGIITDNGTTASVAGNLSVSNSLSLLESTGATYYSTFAAGDQSANISYRLPTTAPAAGNVLKADSLVPTNLVWAAPFTGGNFELAYIEYTVTGNFTLQSNYDVIELVGTPGNFTVTTPAPILGKLIFLYNNTNATATVIANPLQKQTGTILICDGTNWHRMF